MQVFQFLGFAVFLCASLAQAEQTISFPPKQPLVTFQAPDDWKAEMKNGSMFVVSPDGGDVIVEVMTMEAGMKDQAPALKEAKGVVDGDFKKLVLSPLDPTDSNVLNVTLYGGGGEDDSGPAMINRAILKHPEAKHPVLFCLIAAKAKAAEHGAACGAMMNSIKADGRLGRDKSDYYVRNNDDYDNGEFALHVRDMASFKLLISAVSPPRNSPWEDLWEVIWARDDQAFYVGDKVLPIADPANFQNLGQGYAKDAGQVYNQGNRVVPE